MREVYPRRARPVAPGTRHALHSQSVKIVSDSSRQELTRFDSSLGSCLRLKSCSRPPLAMKIYFHSSVSTMTLKSCRTRNFNHADEMFARRAFASEHFKNVLFLARTSRASAAPVAMPKRSRQTDQLSSDRSGGQHLRASSEAMGNGRRPRKVLFLPAVMIAQKIAVIGKKAD